MWLTVKSEVTRQLVQETGGEFRVLFHWPQQLSLGGDAAAITDGNNVLSPNSSTGNPESHTFGF